MGSIVLLLALFLISVLLGADAWRSMEEEMAYLRGNHPERFDMYGRLSHIRLEEYSGLIYQSIHKNLKIYKEKEPIL